MDKGAGLPLSINCIMLDLNGSRFSSDESFTTLETRFVHAVSKGKYDQVTMFG